MERVERVPGANERRHVEPHTRDRMVSSRIKWKAEPHHTPVPLIHLSLTMLLRCPVAVVDMFRDNLEDVSPKWEFIRKAMVYAAYLMYSRFGHTSSKLSQNMSTAATGEKVTIYFFSSPLPLRPCSAVSVAP